jgi:peptide/nickel transport system ATP-binding protein
MLEVAAPIQTAMALSVRGLSKHFGTIKAPVIAVDEVNFELRPGEILGLVGESGSGKSTIARLVAGLTPRSAGEVVIDGRALPRRLSGANARWLRRHVQMIFQDPFASLNPTHSIGYILARPMLIHGLAARAELREKVGALLERVGLSPSSNFIDKQPHELSGGQRQRVGIARALAVEPTLILADEPTSMLDVSIRLDIMNLLLDIREQAGISMVFITHDLAGAKYIADRIAVMYRGTIVESGEVESLIASPLHPYTQMLKRAAPEPRRSADAGDGTPASVPGASTARPRTGCAFAPRCAHRREQCSQIQPASNVLKDGRSVRCFLYEPFQSNP